MNAKAAGRRRVKAGAVAVWAAAALAVASLASAGGCQSTADDATLRGNFNAEPGTLNPLTATDWYAGIIDGRLFDTLIERDYDTLQWKGVLAESWDVAADGRAITFRLNPQAKFSDGSPVTADDVVFTFGLVRHPEIDCRGLAAYFDDCEDCKKIDDRTVRFVWKRPYWKSLETSGSLMRILPRSTYEKLAPEVFNVLVRQPLVGSGPYKLERWDTGQEIVLARNPFFWRPAPAVQRLSFRFIQEEQACIQAFLSGELDDVSLTPEGYARLRDSPDNGTRYRLYRYSTPAGSYRYIAWNNAKPQLADSRVRRAMTMLIDRQAIIDRQLYGLATAISGPFWPQGPQYDQSIRPWPYDKEAALALLKEAGWWDRQGDGWLENERGERLAFELAVPAGPQLSRDIGRVLQEGFRAAGIEMTPRFYEWSVLVTHLGNRDYEAALLGGAGSVEDDPYAMWHSSQIANRGANHMGFRSAEADRLIEEARLTFDENQRQALYHRFHRVLHEEQPCTFLWRSDSLRAFAPRVQGVKVHTLGLDDREWWIGQDNASQ